jgi:hypothetical protein
LALSFVEDHVVDGALPMIARCVAPEAAYRGESGLIERITFKEFG